MTDEVSGEKPVDPAFNFIGRGILDDMGASILGSFAAQMNLPTLSLLSPKITGLGAVMPAFDLGLDRLVGGTAGNLVSLSLPESKFLPTSGFLFPGLSVETGLGALIGGSALHGLSTSIGAGLGHSLGLSDLAGSIVGPMTLAAGSQFIARSAQFASSFSALQDSMLGHSDLQSAFIPGMKTLQQQGAFGPDFTGVQAAAADLSVALEQLPHDAKQAIEAPLREMLNAADIDDELLFEWGSAYGLWERAKTFRPSTAGLLFGTSVGLARFVLGVGQGDPLPVTLFEAVAYGGGAYMLVTRGRQK